MIELSSADTRHIHGGVEANLLTYTMIVLAPYSFFIFATEPFYKTMGAIALCTEIIGLYALNVKDE